MVCRVYAIQLLLIFTSFFLKTFFFTKENQSFLNFLSLYTTHFLADNIKIALWKKNVKVAKNSVCWKKKAYY